MPYSFAAELSRWGPDSAPQAPTLAEAKAYCRNLAQSHYENFTVASWFLPRHMRQHFYNVYAYCRWADDLADETAGGAATLDLLDWWQRELDAMYAGQGSHPVFVALSQTIADFEIPRQPFADLLIAFRQDQAKMRYATFDELLKYCRYSANPVGRIVLHLDQSYDEVNAALSDHVCTGLQLANFWQDVARDWQRGRVYLPQAECRKFCIDEGNPDWGQATMQFRELLKLQVLEAQQFLLAGWPLVGRVTSDLRREVELFISGGLAILDAIRRQDYDVWSRRPQVGKLQKLSLAVRAWWSSRRRRMA
jgi:squalene synthase HpnC